jgi:hypothetical protein
MEVRCVIPSRFENCRALVVARPCAVDYGGTHAGVGNWSERRDFQRGLRRASFGNVRQGEFCLCDGKDPDGNPIQLSDR